MKIKNQRILSLLSIYLFAMLSLPTTLIGVELAGGGASFPYPLYKKIFKVYQQETEVPITYEPKGSIRGFKGIKSQSLDFAGVDLFITDRLMNTLPHPKKLIHVPITLSAVSIPYNLPNNPKLNLTPDILAKIFLGKIINWNDDEIQDINSSLVLPNLRIIPIYRRDGSGTTYILSEYLTKVNDAWKEEMGVGGKLILPTGLGVKGSKNIAKVIQQIPGSISYISLGYALANNLKVAAVENQKNHFIMPDLASISAAANVKMPDDTRIFCSNTDAEKGYPIAAFTWLICYKEQNYNGRGKDKAIALKKLLSWMITEGQSYTEPLGYARIPEAAKMKALNQINSLTYNRNKI